MGRAKLSGIATAAVIVALVALPTTIVDAPADAAPGVVGAPGTAAPISYFTGGHDPAPPPPPPPGCEPDSTDPACQPPPPPPPRHKCGFVHFPIYCRD
jgi:hypothetical protein